MAGESKQPFVSLHTEKNQASLHFYSKCNFFHSLPQLHVTERLEDGNHSNASPTCNDKKD